MISYFLALEATGLEYLVDQFESPAFEETSLTM